MSTKSRPLTKREIHSAIQSRRMPFVATCARLARILGVGRKTIYVWLAAGRLEGCYRKRGKHYIFLMERTLTALFNGAEWKYDK